MCAPKCRLFLAFHPSEYPSSLFTKHVAGQTNERIVYVSKETDSSVAYLHVVHKQGNAIALHCCLSISGKVQIGTKQAPGSQYINY